MNTMLSKALREFTAGPLNQLIVNLGGQDGNQWEEELKRFLRKEPCWTTRNLYLHSVATGKLAITPGLRTLAKAKSLFTGFLDDNFVNWGTDVSGEAKLETPFEVFELVKDGTFEQIFDANRDKLCWSQDQIITFVENHAGLLHPKGWATFFLFKVDEDFFVVLVNRYGDGQLEADAYRLSHDLVWNAEHRYRFVVPA